MSLRNLYLSLFVLAICGLLGCKKADLLFEKITPAHSNIHFNNQLSPDATLNAFSFTNFYNGGGVGVGDFNRDGLPDLFFTGNQVSSELYLNRGNFQFESITEKAGIKTDRWCSGVSIIDINQDGWDDIYLSVAEGPGLKNVRNLLYINQKTSSPSFKESAQAYGLDYAGFTTQSAFFDYDLDGDLDAFLLNTAPDLQNPTTLRRQMNNGFYPSTDKLLRNEGIGKDGHPVFVDVSAEAGIRFEGLGLGLAISDLNQDGYPDIYCSNDFMSSDILYLNQGDGTFKNVIQSAMAHTSQFGMGLDAADLNNDAKIDVFQLDMLPEDNARQKQMLGKHDYDKKELSIAPEYGYELQYMRNMLQINTGNDAQGPIFSDLGLLAGVAKTDWSWATLLSDLDLDGHKDIFITTGYRKNITDLDFIHYYQGSTYFGSDASRAEVREKLLAQVPEVKLRNCAYRNRGDLGFENVAKAWGLDELSYANGAAYADLDQDGDLDLVVNNVDAEASVFKNQSRERQGQNYLKVAFQGQEGNRNGIGATVKVWTQGKAQLYEHFPVRGYLSSVEAGVLIGLGKNQIVDSIQVFWGKNLQETRYKVAANQTLVFRHTEAKPKLKNAAPTAKIFETLPQLLPYQHQQSDFNDFNQTFALHKMRSKNGPAAAVGDLNGDGLNDVVFGNAYRGRPGNIFLQQKNGSFKALPGLNTAEFETGDLAIFDADGDGDQDILSVGGGNEQALTVKTAYQPILWLNDGQAHFTQTNQFPTLAVSSQAVRPFDYDDDGDLDLFIGGRQIPGTYPLPAASYLLRNDGGRFTDVSQTVAPLLQQLGLVCDALPLDVDQDKDIDLVIVGEWMPITILENQKGRFVAKTLPNSEGWWNSLAAGDFDQDGDPDLLLGNEGLNTFYRASPTEPIEMLAKDFNQDGKVDPIMGYFIQGKCVPALPRDALNQQMVQFRRKYALYADYAKVGFADLFSKKERADAQELQAKELRSCYAENQGNGQFVLKPLPLLAQQSPIFGFLVKDVDGDGHLDALATGNFYANEGHMGRQDASRGIWLKGNGKGGFVVVPNEESGLAITGDARRSYWIDTNRFFTTLNGGEVLAQRIK
ncbi:VCBS repeat-containing protein [Haliscomenobacter sp.]|uniref:VCBS repeat-containing protein n=1 Tax=Haliscomenobacter sp. TaxID=2717303 RepID=UPI00359341E8